MQPDVRADLKLQLGPNRQGYTPVGLGDWHPPQVMGLGVDSARRIQELQWAYEVSRVINASVQPETYQVAKNVVSYVQERSGPLFQEVVARSHNRIIHGKGLTILHPLFHILHSI